MPKESLFGGADFFTQEDAVAMRRQRQSAVLKRQHHNFVLSMFDIYARSPNSQTMLDAFIAYEWYRSNRGVALDLLSRKGKPSGVSKVTLQRFAKLHKAVHGMDEVTLDRDGKINLKRLQRPLSAMSGMRPSELCKAHVSEEFIEFIMKRIQALAGVDCKTGGYEPPEYLSEGAASAAAPSTPSR